MERRGVSHPHYAPGLKRAYYSPLRRGVLGVNYTHLNPRGGDMYQDRDSVMEAYGQAMRGEIEFSEFADIAEYYDGDLAELL